jgi:hypothetical protein
MLYYQCLDFLQNYVMKSLSKVLQKTNILRNVVTVRSNVIPLGVIYCICVFLFLYFKEAIQKFPNLRNLIQRKARS